MSQALKRQKKQADDLTQLINWENFDKVAVEYYCCTGSLAFKYSEVFEAQNIIKNLLNELEPSEFIGIYCDTPAYCIPAIILGILSSRRSFVYIAKNELEFLKNTLNIQYIFHLNSNKNLGDQVKAHQVHQQSIILSKTSFPAKESSNLNLAYAVTTSGSTGQPVIVKVSHTSILINIEDFKNILKLTSFDKVAQLTPLTFDPSYVEIFISFLAGSTLCTFADELKNHPDALLKVLYDKKITFISTTPSLFLHRWKFNDLKETLLSKESFLRFLLLGGEPFPNSKVIRRIKHPDNCTRIFSVYGITEVSCWASINEVFFQEESDTDNLGALLSDTLFQVRSEENSNEIVDGEGILYIGSYKRICLIADEKLCDLESPVYRNTGDLVAIKNNIVRFKGRRDSFIKRFGRKVYLDKLKNHLLELDFIKDLQIIFYSNLSQLHLFFTLNEFDESYDNAIARVWSHVKLLPDICPDKIHCLENFKVTDRGKICKDYLKEFSMKSSKSSSDPMSLLENIWGNYLLIKDTEEAKSVGFVDLGGTSVIALQISNNLLSETGNSYPELIGMLFDNKTLLECQDYLSKYSNNVNSNSKVLTGEISHNFSSKNNLLKDLYIWQKCRGRTIFLNPKPTDTCNLFNCNYESNSIKLKKVFNLEKCVDASPTVFGYSNDESFATVSSHSGFIITVDLKTEDNWKIKLPDRVEASILVLDNFKGIVGCHDGFIYCLNLKTGEIYWKFQTGSIVKCLAAVCCRKENIFFGSYDHFVYCISSEGSLVWKLKVEGSTLATPLVNTETDTVIFSLLNANCICMNQKTGEVRWKYQCSSSIFSTPNILSSVLILADVRGNVVGLNINTGDQLWSFNISGNIFSDIVISTDDTSFMFTSKNGFFYKYNLKETNYPELHYKIDFESSVVATPWVEKNLVVIVREDGELRVIELKNGKFLYNFKLSGDSFSSPILHNKIIVVGCRDDNLYTLYLKD